MSGKHTAVESADPLHKPEVAPNVPRSQTRKLTAISERKLKANRENAKKSPGPRTARGKEYSRRNATKHGLFARHPVDFVLLGENCRNTMTY